MTPCEFCERTAVYLIQGYHVCNDQYCKFRAWQMEPKK